MRLWSLHPKHDERGWDDELKKLCRKNAQDRSQYRGLYTSELREIVATRYADDIVMFDYSFP